MNKINLKNNVLIITLDQNGQNLLTDPEFISIELIKKTYNESHFKAIIIKGEGRHFSAGASVKSIKEQVSNNSIKEKIIKGKQLLNYLQDLKIPIIACIEGACFGGGLEIALSADIRIASRKSLFAFPETSLNIIPGLNGIINLSKKAGKDKALELILSGELIDAETGKKIGIIDEIVDKKETFDYGFKLSQKMVKNRSLDIINAVVSLTRNASHMSFGEASEIETETFCNLAIKAAKNNDL
jgi:enoyl-CoA hydratase